MNFKSRVHKMLRPSKRLIVVFFVALLAGLLAGTFIHSLLEPDPWNPLGPYSEQQVDSTGPLVASPVNDNVFIPQVKLGTKVRSIGQKCSKETVKVTGRYGWRSIVPGGFVFTFPEGPPGVRIAGCATFDFRNEIPPEVDQWARESLVNGPVEVFLSGCETPIRDDGTMGVETCWHTESFQLVLP